MANDDWRDDSPAREPFEERVDRAFRYGEPLPSRRLERQQDEMSRTGRTASRSSVRLEGVRRKAPAAPLTTERDERALDIPLNQPERLKVTPRYTEAGAKRARIRALKRKVSSAKRTLKTLQSGRADISTASDEREPSRFEEQRTENLDLSGRSEAPSRAEERREPVEERREPSRRRSFLGRAARSVGRAFRGRR
jgi:hypothetical protein